MAIASLVIGIVTLIISLVGFWWGPLSIAGFLLGILGIVLAGVSMAKFKKGTAGLVLNILSTLFSLIPAIMWILLIVAASTLS